MVSKFDVFMYETSDGSDPLHPLPAADCYLDTPTTAPVVLLLEMTRVGCMHRALQHRIVIYMYNLMVPSCECKDHMWNSLPSHLQQSDISYPVQ